MAVPGRDPGTGPGSIDDSAWIPDGLAEMTSKDGGTKPSW